ncbi:ATP-grasp fold amidoligase family protein [Halobacterium salinarum]|uniref:ATP-grasp fold amidoligase family protein n=1 Tax=Halobacterium salinarum TaxID=2242 RepID=UPI002556612B|nr:ATP-grasp fold amidoligase family protein [Halobacterium salinarum]
MAPRVGYWPEIKSPRSFNEKIVHRKLFTDDEVFVKVSDKWLVRDYVARKVGSDILNEVYHVGQNPEDIPFDELPDSFVLKGNHGSGFNRIVEDKARETLSDLKRECSNWLSESYGESKHEYWYSKIDPRIIVENLLSDEEYGIPLDYKFHVFGGKVEYIQVDIDRFGDHTRRMYTQDWEPKDFTLKYPLGPDIPEPEKLDEMISVAQKLGGDFDYVRVDLYQPDGEKIVFGELTLAPGTGHERFTPKRWDFKLGSEWPVENMG